MASNSGAGGSSPASSSVLCKYFMSNACNKGSSCPFSHDRNSKPDTVCRFYLAGKCAYGTTCRYDHKRPQLAASNKNATVEHSKPNSDSNAKKACSPRSSESSQSRHKLSATAPEFVPSWLRAPQGENTYASASGSTAVLPLCPYFETGNCDKGEECMLVHGLLCDMCNVACLHPADAHQRTQHRRECLAAHESAMEQAFAEARSIDKVCGICMENIRERDARFGILEKCRHCFCLECIRHWRRNQHQQFEKETVRSCPECRTHSDFVIPAKYWVDDEEDKKKLKEAFLANTKQKQCKYLRTGTLDDCPFGNRCFYKHEMPDGTIAEGRSPSQLRRAKTGHQHPRRPNVFDLLTHEYATSLFFNSDSDSDDDFFINSLLSQALGLL